MHPTSRAALLVLAAATLLLLLVPAVAAAVPQQHIPLDGSPTLRGLPAPFQVFPNGEPSGPLAQGLPLHEGREPDKVLWLYDFDPAHPGAYQVPFWKEYVGEHSDVYVAWNDLAAPPESTQQDQTITDEQVTYIGREFDARIWESDVFHFGWYDARPATDPVAGRRAAIMVYNIRDEAYWSSYRFYTAGYFWGSLNDELQMNAIFVDSYNWKDRLGPDSARPYLYEGTVAHEFQHLIHNDVDPDEDSFIDEGMADLAEQFLYGTITTSSHIGEALYYHRDSLVDWKGELFDYGTSVLWQDYLWERAGGTELGASVAERTAAGKDPFSNSPDKFADPGDAFTWNLIHDQANGLGSVAGWVGGMDDVERLHRDWTFANLLDGKVAEPQWNYRSLALGGADSDYLTIADGIRFYNAQVRGNMPPTRKNVWRRAVTEAWGPYYRTFQGVEPAMTFTFSGAATAGVEAHSAPTQWYSGLGNMLDIGVSRRFDVAPGDTLSFWTWYDIEPDWDYGYVEASTDGSTWTKLVQTSSLPAGASNVNGSSAWDGAGGFTANSGDWQQATFDLGGLSGQVWIRFRYLTDESANGLGWYVDDVTVGTTTDAVDSADAWTNDGWAFTTGLQANDWTADMYVPWAKDRRTGYSVKTLVGLGAVEFAGQVTVSTQYSKDLRLWGIMGNRPTGLFTAEGRLTVRKGR
jgi:hypothetical protein